MFHKLSALALFLPLVAGLTLEVPRNIVSQGTVTIRWTAQAGDDVFSLYLVNEEFNDSFAIANNVDPSLGELTLTVGSVPVRDGYTLKATNIGNINEVYSETAPFSVGPTPSTSASSSAAASSSASATGSGASTSVTATSTRPGVTPSATGSPSAIPSATTRPSVSTTSTSTATATPFNNSAAPFKMNSQVGALAAVFFSAIAGAAIFAL